MVNSFRRFGNGNSFAVRNWTESRWYIRIHYCPLLFIRDASRNRRHHTEVAVSCVITWLPPNHRNSKRHSMSFAIQPLRKICCTFKAAYVRGPGFVLVADLHPKYKWYAFSLSRWWPRFSLQTSLHRKCNKRYLHYQHSYEAPLILDQHCWDHLAVFMTQEWTGVVCVMGWCTMTQYFEIFQRI